VERLTERILVVCGTERIPIERFPASSYTRLAVVRPVVESTDFETPTASEATDSETAADAELAIVGERVAAYLLDLLVVGGGVVAAAGWLGGSRREQFRIGGLLGLAVANLYHLVLEGRDGQTVGKRSVGIAVVAGDGEECTYTAAGTRTLFRFADWLPAGYLLGFVSIALTERRKRLGDIVANTVVVRNRSESEER
jgi:uncharacterized RDD family membrane protein YckC